VNTNAQEKVFVAQDGTRFVQNVTEPSLTVFRPEGKANGTAVVICPGGGYHLFAIDYEGNDIAQWLTSFGVTAFVLKYRVYPTGDDPLNEVRTLMAGRPEFHEHLKTAIPLADEDGQQAIRIVRQHAAKWKIASNRIILMGFSSGGGVTVDVALKHDAESRPDFVAPIYPNPEAVSGSPRRAALVCGGGERGCDSEAGPAQRAALCGVERRGQTGRASHLF
jgi:acetyl esterase/lipase